MIQERKVGRRECRAGNRKDGWLVLVRVERKTSEFKSRMDVKLYDQHRCMCGKGGIRKSEL